MPPKNLTPRVPGEALPPTETDPTTAPAAVGTEVVDAAGVTTDPADQLRAELEAIASLNVPEVLESLTTLNRDELILLHAIETDGKGRVTVLGPISDQLNVLADADAAAGGEGAQAGAGEDGTVAAADRLATALGAPNLIRHGAEKGLAEHAAAAKKRRAGSGPITKAEQPAAVLTAEGWVVPEPEPKE